MTKQERERFEKLGTEVHKLENENTRLRREKETLERRVEDLLSQRDEEQGKAR